MKPGRLFISEFEAEERLRKADSFSLPSLSLFRKRDELLLDGMDALAVTMADKGDTVITRIPLSEAYLRWWNDTFSEIRNCSPKPCDEAGPDGRETIYRLLERDPAMHGLLRENRIVNYAVTKDCYDLCESLSLKVMEPSLSVIEMLSRKSWSNELRRRFGFSPYGVSVSSIEEFDICIQEMLVNYGRVLIKDSMGVSGRGIVPADSLKTAQRISLHFRKQREEGKKNFDFVIEPYLNKTMDFSCQLRIAPDGEIRIDGYRKNTGKGFGYRSSSALSEAELKLIFASGYREDVMKIAGAMAEAGYFGYACIDSMIADESTVIPLLEINPRMSMGRFSLSLENRCGKHCLLSFAEGTASAEVTADMVLSDLEASGLLYSKTRSRGIVPLAPSAWDRKKCAGNRVRIYYAVVYDSEEDYETVLDSWLGYCARRICTGPVT